MKTFWTVAIVIALLALSFFVGRGTKSCSTETRVDTLVVHDTIRDTVLREVTRYVTRTVRDTTLVIIRDSITNEVYVEVPIEKVRYQSENYDLWVEGYQTKLLSIDVYRDTYYIDRIQKYKTKPRWGVGVQIGYGYNFHKFYPYVGVGLQYNLLTW